MHGIDEQTVGQLFRTFRARTGLKADDVVPFLMREFDSMKWSNVKISNLENDRLRLEQNVVEKLARIYRVTPMEKTALFRAADIPASDSEQSALLERVAHTLDACGFPALVVDYRGMVRYWNPAFTSLHARGGAGSSISAPDGGTADARSFAPPIDDDGFLRLHDTMQFFTLVFSNRSRLRALLDATEWDRIAHFLLVRFWRATHSLLQAPAAGPAGWPTWLRESQAGLEALPPPDGDTYRQRSAAIRARLEDSWTESDVDLVRPPFYDRLLVRVGVTRYLLTPTPLDDVRFQAYHFHQANAS